MCVCVLNCVVDLSLVYHSESNSMLFSSLSYEFCLYVLSWALWPSNTVNGTGTKDFQHKSLLLDDQTS